jgi:uncharacterized protein (DUF1778 family)
VKYTKLLELAKTITLHSILNAMMDTGPLDAIDSAASLTGVTQSAFVANAAREELKS